MFDTIQFMIFPYVSTASLDAIKAGAGRGQAMDPSVVFYPDQYCPVVEAMPTACYETSILELFASEGKFDEQSEERINNLSQNQLIDMINNMKHR